MMQGQGLSCRLTRASSSEGFSDFVLSRIWNVLSSRLPSKNAMLHLEMTRRYAQPDPPCSLTSILHDDVTHQGRRC
jgi:hypothetical protein